MATPRLFILTTLPGGSHRSGPEFQLSAGDRFLALALVKLLQPTHYRTGCLQVSLRMRPTCRQLPAGSTPGQVLLSFPRRCAPQTAGEVKDSWASACSQGRSRGLNSFLPVSARPEGFSLQRILRLYLVASSLYLSAKSRIPGGNSSRFGNRIARRALGSNFFLSCRQLQQGKQTKEWRETQWLGSASLQCPRQLCRGCARITPESLSTRLISLGALSPSGT
nr:uncharacterized protein LOC105866484 [Microcebus murinus]